MKAIEDVFKFVQATLSLFKAAPNLEIEKFPKFTLNNEKNLANGFFVTERAFKVCPIIATDAFRPFLKDKFGYDIFELNQGFYKSFQTVANSSPKKILVNKLLHYMSTYGMEQHGIFDRDLVYIPNDALELPENAKPVKITIIDTIENAEIEARTLKMLQSGVALSEGTVSSLVDIVRFLDIKLNIDEVPNKEFAIRLCELLNILPNDPVQFLRYMIYRLTGSMLLIKSHETISNLKYRNTKFSPILVDYSFSRYIDNNGIEKLAGVFHRFKPLWLAFKQQSAYMKSTINKMRKLADRYHKPAPPKFLERLTSAAAIDTKRLKSELAKITVFKKISLANSILYRISNPENIIYRIRNGKAFVDEYSGSLKFDAREILSVIVDSIVEDVKPNVQGKKIYIPANFNYAAPVSEKRFVGNIPHGSSYTFAEKSVVVGAHWLNIIENNNEIRVDLDLHLNSETIDIGWQNDFKNENFINTKERKIIFSGDMTDAPIRRGGATEAYFIGETLTDEMLMVNLNHYNHHGETVPFKLILADVNQEDIDRQYLLDAHEIAFCVPIEISTYEMFLGFLVSNELGEKKFYFSTATVSDRRVAQSDELTGQIISAMSTTLKSFLSLNEILEKAGAIIENADNSECDINLAPAEVTKDTLIGLLAK